MHAINSLGERLREEREKLGLSINEISERTHIRQRYLEALERGDYSVMPGEVYLKGFLRSYAEALGLNGWDFVEEYNRSIAPPATEGEEAEATKEAQSPQKTAAKHLIMQNPIIMPTKDKFLHNKSYQDRRLVLLAVLVLLSVAAYLVWIPDGVKVLRSGNSITETVTEPVNLPAEPTPVQVAQETPSEPIETTPASVAVAPVEPKPPVMPVSVKLSALEDCWVEVYTDGRHSFTGVILAGSTREIGAEQKVQVRLGNPEGVVILHNGVKIGSIGEEVQTRVFTRDNHYPIDDYRREEQPPADQGDLAGVAGSAEN